MGVGDVSLKKWLGNKNRFADLFNSVLYGGKCVIKPEELQCISEQRNLIVKDKNNEKRAVWRYRDIVMSWQGNTLAILAIENQEKVSYIMPVRNMIYDGLAYMEQIDTAWSDTPKEKRKKLSQGEFMSRYKKGQLLTPVVTIVFYYGKEKWDGAKDLYGMLGMSKLPGEKNTLEKVIPNYRINLIDVNDMKNIKNLQDDLQTMFGMLKYKKDKKKLRKYMMDNAEYFNSLDEYGYGTVAALLGEGERFLNFVSKELKEHKEGKEEVPIVCKAIDDIYNDGIKLGKREGKREGRMEERIQIAQRMLAAGMNLGDVVKYTKLTAKEQEILVSQLQTV